VGNLGYMRVNRVKRGLLVVNVRKQGETWITWANVRKQGKTWVIRGKCEKTG